MAGKDVVPKSVTWGLFVAWAVHDAEELVTMPGWVGRSRQRLTTRLPWVPARVWDRLDVSRTHATVAIGLMGGVLAAASFAGARTGGRSGLYQAVLTGFGWHSLTHVAQAVATGGYAPGVVTAPTVVAPFSLWARRKLRAAGIERDGGAWSLVLLPVVLAAVHGAASRIDGHSRAG